MKSSVTARQSSDKLVTAASALLAAIGTVRRTISNQARALILEKLLSLDEIECLDAVRAPFNCRISFIFKLLITIEQRYSGFVDEVLFNFIKEGFRSLRIYLNQ